MARAVVVNAAQLASYSQSKQALLDSGTNAPTHAHAHVHTPPVDRAAFAALRLFRRRHLVSFLRQYDQRPGHHGGVHACGHREDQVRPLFLPSRGEEPVQEVSCVCFLCACVRIQNMRMIDGKPEYKNGLVSGSCDRLRACLRSHHVGARGRRHAGLAFISVLKRKIPKLTCCPSHAVHQEVLLRVVRAEGFFSLWKGFTPYYARLGPHTVLTFIFLEQMNRLYKTYVLDR